MSQLPTKAEKAAAIVKIVIGTHQSTVGTLETFGKGLTAASISATQIIASMAQLGRAMSVSTQPEEHPLAKAVKKATEEK